MERLGPVLDAHTPPTTPLSSPSNPTPQAPGTYLGLVERLDYLKRLGINAIELLPVGLACLF